MPAGTPPGLGPVLAWRNACATPSMHVPGESVRAEPTSRDAHR